MRLVALVLAATLLVPTGCASPHPPPLALHLALAQQRIALVPDTSAVEGSVDLFARNRAVGALKGAGTGVVAGVGMAASGSCSGAICGAALVALLAVAVVAGTTVGLVVGAVQATPKQEAERIDRAVAASVEQLPAHLDVAKRLLAVVQREDSVRLELVSGAAPGGAERPEPGALRAQGFESALEVGVRRIEFAGGRGEDPELSLGIEAVARLVDTATGRVLYEREFQSLGAPRRFSAWVADGGEPMRLALADGLQALAEDMASTLFSQVDLGIAAGSWAFPGTHGYGSCWLTPVYPPSEYAFLGRELEWPAVPGKQLTLRWEPFPSEGQRATLERRSGQSLGAVAYDLRIWDVRGEERGALVYERRGLPAPEHALEQPLAARHRYFWSARACFALGGGTACTPWASSLVPSRDNRRCEDPDIPAWNYYRFETR